MKNYGIIPQYMIPQCSLINFNTVRNCDCISLLNDAINFKKRHPTFYSEARAIYSIDRLYSNQQEIPINAYKYCVNRNTPPVKGLIETYDVVLPELSNNMYIRPTLHRMLLVLQKYL